MKIYPLGQWIDLKRVPQEHVFKGLTKFMTRGQRN